MTWRTPDCELRVMANMNYSESWAQGFRCYDQHTILDDMNISISHDLKPLDSMNSSRKGIISLILGREPMSPNAMNNSGLWMKLKTSSHKVRALDIIKISELWITWTTPGHGLMDLDAMNSSELWLHEWLRVMSWRLLMLWITQGYDRYVLLWLVS